MLPRNFHLPSLMLSDTAEQQSGWELLRDRDVSKIRDPFDEKS